MPAAWWFRGRRRGSPFPYGVDTLLGLPFLIDVPGNAFDLYDSMSWWDDVNHHVTLGDLSLGLLRLRDRRCARRSRRAPPGRPLALAPSCGQVAYGFGPDVENDATAPT